MLTPPVLAADAVISASAGGILFFQPHRVADFVFARQTDGVHWHLVRCLGGQLLASAFVTWRLRKSSSTAHTVCHVLRIMAAILTLLLVFQCRSVTPNLINLQYLEYMKYACFAGLTVHILLLLISGWQIGATTLPGNRIGDCLYQLDAMASICIGVAWLAFPSWLLHRQVAVNLDASHDLCGRLMGALFVASYAVSAHALHWTSKFDRGVAVDGRVVCCLAILSAQVWSQYAYEEHWGGGHWVGISLFSTWTITAVLYRLCLPIFCGNSGKRKTK